VVVAAFDTQDLLIEREVLGHSNFGSVLHVFIIRYSIVLKSATYGDRPTLRRNIEASWQTCKKQLR
jgi:hypothetical protein